MKISVRGLVEFLLRHGDIDNKKNSVSDEAMQEGSRIHRKIQGMMGSLYRAEYPLKYEMVTEYSTVMIEGRADGIMTIERPDDVRELPDCIGVSGDWNDQLSDTFIVIDEIKSTYKDVTKMDEPEIVHLAQARVYAAIYSMLEDLPIIGVQMTYVRQESDEIRYFRYAYAADEIRQWFGDLTLEFAKWVDNQAKWISMRQESIHSLEFPYPYRSGQRDLVEYVYRTIYHEKKLYIEAPTGTGKTLSVLFPAVRSVGEGRGDKIFYLTARTIARTVAEETISILKDHGLKYRNLTLTAKEKICFTEEHECNPSACPYAKGHFDRINDCLYEIITSGDDFSREVIEEYAQKYQVCPFELSLDISLFADLIIGDYNYVFDPNAYLRRFFADGRDGDYLFLIDEAHNLVDRGREMYSGILIKEHFLTCKRACKEYWPRISRAIDKCNSDMLKLKRLGNDKDYHEHIGDMTILDESEIAPLVGHVDRLKTVISEYLADHNEGPAHEEILDLYFELSDFLKIYDIHANDYTIYTDFTGDGEFFLKLFCVDPSRNLADCMGRARSNILFSATLLPIQYYKSLLGGTKEDYEVYANSIFDPDKRLLIMANDVSSKYSDRSYNMYMKIAEYIHKIASAKKGNYMVFAPSYSFMDEVYSIYLSEFNDTNADAICQTNQMKEKEKEKFLERFREENENTLIGFCVLGGVFSEGIDLKEDALIGVIVIGTGLPQIGGERDLLKEYFDEAEHNGFDYAYRYPGMNRVLQAAGRLIRTESDRGVVALLDNRYAQGANKRLFPREWDNIKTVNITTVDDDVKQFWSMVK